MGMGMRRMEAELGDGISMIIFFLLMRPREVIREIRPRGFASSDKGKVNPKRRLPVSEL